MRFSSDLDAKQFFIEKISRQAEKSGISLSEAENYMLKRAGIERGSSIEGKKLRNQFYSQTTHGEFEEKVASLIKKSYETEVNSDVGGKEIYRNAYKALKQGDHYIQMMIDESIGRKIKKVRIF